MDAEPSQFSSFFQKPSELAYRGKFLSRLFGIFNEQLVRFWAEDERSPYRDIGRPSVSEFNGGKGYTLDFTFENRTTGKRFVVEMKCEIEFQDYRFMTLREPSQLMHHKKPAFELFRRIAQDPRSCRVQVNRQAIDVAGAILIWGDVTETGRSAAKAEYSFHDILAMDHIIADLRVWRPEPFVLFTQSLGNWSNELFEFLYDERKPMVQVFKNNEAGYIGWRDGHPDGFICNIPYSKGVHSWKPICVHKATCRHLASNKNGERLWTTTTYFKICSDKLQTVKEWISHNVELPTGWQLRRCRSCGA